MWITLSRIQFYENPSGCVAPSELIRSYELIHSIPVFRNLNAAKEEASIRQ
jgi:hypothetical protein